MTKETIINSLDDARKIAFSLWIEYRDRALDSSIWSDVRDYYDIRVRALDYAMEVLRHDTV